MFTIEPQRYISKVFAAWAFFLIILSLYAGMYPTLLAAPVGIFLVGLFFCAVQCAYRTERLSTYGSFLMFCNLAIGPALAALGLMIVFHKQMHLGAGMSAGLSVLPALATAGGYAALYAWSSPASPLHFNDTRVEVGEMPCDSRLLAGTGAGLGVLLGPFLIAYRSTATLLVLLFLALSVFMLVYHRHNITALRTLKAREEREGVYYRFMELEAIRQKRMASVIGRLFKPQRHN